MATSTPTITAGPILAIDWTIEPKGFFSPNFNLYCRGDFVTTLQMKLWREGCSFSIAGHEFNIRKPSMWKDAFELVASDTTVCEVNRSFWSRRFELSGAGQQWVLQPVGLFSTTYQLLAGEREVGRVSLASWWSRRRSGRFAEEVPPPVQVLAIFLVLIVANRQSKSQ